MRGPHTRIKNRPCLSINPLDQIPTYVFTLERARGENENSKQKRRPASRSGKKSQKFFSYRAAASIGLRNWTVHNWKISTMQHFSTNYTHGCISWPAAFKKRLVININSYNTSRLHFFLRRVCKGYVTDPSSTYCAAGNARSCDSCLRHDIYLAHSASPSTLVPSSNTHRTKAPGLLVSPPDYPTTRPFRAMKKSLLILASDFCSETFQDPEVQATLQHVHGHQILHPEFHHERGYGSRQYTKPGYNGLAYTWRLRAHISLFSEQLKPINPCARIHSAHGIRLPSIVSKRDGSSRSDVNWNGTDRCCWMLHYRTAPPTDIGKNIVHAAWDLPQMASVYTRILKQYIPPIHPLTFRIFLLVQFPSTRYINRASTWLVPRRHLPPLSALNVLLSSNNPTPNAFPALKLADREIFNAKPLIGTILFTQPTVQNVRFWHWSY